MFIFYCNEPDKEHLEKVKKEMEVLGSPVIHVFSFGTAYIALEGIHRLFAARELKVKPILRVINNKCIIKGHDFEDFSDIEEGFKLGSYVLDSALTIYFEDDEKEFIIDESKDNYILVDFKNLTYQGLIE